MISGIEGISLAPLASLSVGGATAPDSFEKWVLKELAETNRLVNKSEMDLQRLAVGDAKSVHEVMLSLEKANTAFNLTLQVRNKLLDGYKEIMRMQV